MKNKKILIAIVAIIILLVAGITTFIYLNNKHQEELKSMPISTNKKVLVVYFSYSGNTEKLANKIKEKVNNCDIIEIETVEPYSDDYETY